MIDARNVYRKVTRKIYDFTPEQQKNLSAIVWLYRGHADRFVELVVDYLERMIEAMGHAIAPLRRLSAALAEAIAARARDGLSDDLAERIDELKTTEATFGEDVERFEAMVQEISNAWQPPSRDNESLKDFAERAEPLADVSRDLIRQADHLYNLLSRLAEATKKNDRGSPLRPLDQARKEAVEHLKSWRYFRRQAHWLQQRFPSAELRDVEGLVKLVDLKELEENDWSLSPGRYVGVAPEEEDEDFDFEETIREIHTELDELNADAAHLAATMKRNFEELAI